MRALFEGLGLGRMIEFCEMNPDGFDHYAIGGERFDVPAGFGRYLERLLTRFPHERAGLLRYHEVLTRVIAVMLSLVPRATTTMAGAEPTMLRIHHSHLLERSHVNRQSSQPVRSDTAIDR